MKRYCSICNIIDLDEEKKPYSRFKPNPKYDYSIRKSDRKSGEIAKYIHDTANEEKLILSGRIDDDLELHKHLTITEGIEKMKGINSLNTDARDNPNCMRLSKNPDLVCSKCYSISGVEGRKKTDGPSRRVNSKLLTKRVYEPEEFPSRKISENFRISAHGDIIDDTHAKNIINFLKQQFDLGKINNVAWWTKLSKYMRTIKSHAKYMGVDLNKISFVFSTFKLNDMNVKSPPSGFDKVFTVYSADFIDSIISDGTIKSEKKFINCGGRDCKGCLRCYRKGGESIIREKLK